VATAPAIEYLRERPVEREATIRALDRVLAPKSLSEFCRVASHGRWQASRFHRHLCGKLEAVERGEITRLMVFIPSQHGKSDVISRNFPAYALGRNPDRRMILTSYAAGLAHSLSRDARRIMEGVGEELFGVKVSAESSAVSHWEIAGRQGRLHAAGVGGPIGGHGADIAIIDDPHKGPRDARNRRHTRDLFENWYKGVLRPRVPNGAIVVVSTRFDVRDLPGWLLWDAENGGEQWEVVRLPAMAEANDPLGRAPGEPLWPERIGVTQLEAIRSSTRGHAWQSVYQQDPQAEVEGALWTQQMLDDLRRAQPPELKRVIVAVDPAVTSNADSNETGIIVGGLGVDDHAYILDDRSGVFSPYGWAQRAVEAYHRREADCVVGEVNNGGDLVETNVRTIDPNIPFRQVRASRGKAVRAEPIALLYEQGRVHHVGSDFGDLEAQLTHMTPNGYEGEESPDRLDALVWLVSELILVEAAQAWGFVA